MDRDQVIRDFCERFSGHPEDNLFVRRLQEFLAAEDIARVIRVMGETCPECFDTPRGCLCWNDD